MGVAPKTNLLGQSKWQCPSLSGSSQEFPHFTLSSFFKASFIQSMNLIVPIVYVLFQSMISLLIHLTIRFEVLLFCFFEVFFLTFSLCFFVLVFNACPVLKLFYITYTINYHGAAVAQRYRGQQSDQKVRVLRRLASSYACPFSRVSSYHFHSVIPSCYFGCYLFQVWH